MRDEAIKRVKELDGEVEAECAHTDNCEDRLKRALSRATIAECINEQHARDWSACVNLLKDALGHSKDGGGQTSVSGEEVYNLFLRFVGCRGLAGLLATPIVPHPQRNTDAEALTRADATLDLVTALRVATQSARETLSPGGMTEDARKALAEAREMIEHLKARLQEVAQSRHQHAARENELDAKICAARSLWNDPIACEARAKTLREDGR